MTRHLIAGAAALAILGLGFLAWNALVPRERDTPVSCARSRAGDRRHPPGKIVEEGTSHGRIRPWTNPSVVPVAAPELPPLDESDEFVLAQLDELPRRACFGLAERLAERPRGPSAARDGSGGDRGARRTFARPCGASSRRPPANSGSSNAESGTTSMPRTFHRYDAAVDALTCVPPERLAALVRLLRPLLMQALRELGLPDADVDTVLDNALRAILSVPIPQLPIEVVRADGAYTYAHAKLEAASPLSKQLVTAGTRQSSTGCNATSRNCEACCEGPNQRVPLNCPDAFPVVRRPRHERLRVRQSANRLYGCTVEVSR